MGHAWDFSGCQIGGDWSIGDIYVMAATRGWNARFGREIVNLDRNKQFGFLVDIVSAFSMAYM